MATAGITEARAPAKVQPVGSGTFLQRALLGCGILASVLYSATDVLGGLSYPGYSFNSQGISELMAIGAPAEPLVDPLFLVYDVLMLAFGVGVWRAARASRLLRVCAILLMAYGALGFTGPTLFPMHQRGADSSASDLAHIVLTAVLVLLMLTTITLSAFALGRRFRVYSLVTLGVLIVFGSISGAYGARIAANLPTPGFGVIERIIVYSALLWVAVLAFALKPGRSPADP
jgi:hypothetical protein